MPPRFNLAINVAPEEPMAGPSGGGGGGGGGSHLEVGGADVSHLCMEKIPSVMH